MTFIRALVLWTVRYGICLTTIAVAKTVRPWLVDRVFFRREGPSSSTRRILYPKDGLILGVELGGTTCVAAVADPAAPTVILSRIEVPTTDPVETITAITDWAKQRGPIISIGLASFGPIQLDKTKPDYGQVLVSTPKVSFRGANLVDLFADFHVPVFFDTDVNAPAIAELKYGGHRDATSCVYITVGTGVGVGAVVNGAPVHGAMHMEGGHYMPSRLSDDNYEGWCRTHRDCLEGLTSSRAIADRAGVDITKLADLPDSDPVWQITAHYLAQLCATITYLLSPHVIVLGGGVLNRRPLLGMIHEQFNQIINGYVQIPLITDEIQSYICRSSFKSDSGIIGALALGMG